MANPTITVSLDPETAKIYASAPPEKRRQIQALLALWLRQLATAEPGSLQELMDDIERKAKEQGLTPELLDSLLKGA